MGEKNSTAVPSCAFERRTNFFVALQNTRLPGENKRCPFEAGKERLQEELVLVKKI